MPSWIALLRRRPDFRRLWLSGVVSMMGDFLSFVSIALLSLEASDGPLVLATTLTVHQLPAALIGAFAGTIVDRVDRRKLLIAANVIQAVLTVIGALSVSHSIVLVQAVVLLRSAVSAFIVPGETAAMRRLVSADELPDANALFATTWSLSFVVGMAAGGLLAELGPERALLVDAGTFVFAVAMAAGLPALVPERDVPERYSFTAEIREALALTREEPRLRPVLIVKVAPALMWGAAWLCLHLTAESARPFGTAAISVGVLQAVRGVGTGIGPLVATRAFRSGHAAPNVLGAALGVLAIAVAVFVVVRDPVVMAGAALLWGAGSGASWVLSSTLLQQMAGDARVGRLTALDELFNVVAMQLSAFLTAVAVTLGATSAESAIVPFVLALAIGVPNLLALRRASARGATSAIGAAG